MRYPAGWRFPYSFPAPRSGGLSRSRCGDFGPAALRERVSPAGSAHWVSPVSGDVAGRGLLPPVEFPAHLHSGALRGRSGSGGPVGGAGGGALPRSPGRSSGAATAPPRRGSADRARSPCRSSFPVVIPGPRSRQSGADAVCRRLTCSPLFFPATGGH